MRPLAIAASALLFAACSPIAAECDKAAECGELGSRSADQCTADWEKWQADLEKNPDCQVVVEKTLALFDCQSDLTCEERKHLSDTPCKEASSDLLGATLSNLGCLFE